MSRRATLSVILAGILWGVISIFIRKLSAGGLDSLQISFIRLTIAAVVFTSFIAITDPSKLRIKLKDIWMFIGTGIISVTLFNTFYFYTMINSQASVAVVLLYTSPVFIMLMSAFLFKEKVTLKKLAAIVMTLAGCVLVTGLLGISGGAGGIMSLSFGSNLNLSPVCIITGLCSGLFYALYSIFGKYALAKYDSMTVTVYTFLFGMLGSIPFGKPAETVSVLYDNPKLILWGVGIGIISTVLPYFFYTWGLKYLESGKAAIFVAVEPLVGAILGMTAYHEEHGIIKILGIMLIMSAIIILNIKEKSKNEVEKANR